MSTVVETAPDRGFRYVVREQTPLSAASALLGAGALGVLVVGTIGVLTSFGWTPSQQLAEGITSGAQGAVLLVAAALGLAGVALGAWIYRRLPTKPSREGAVAGVVLGAQALVLVGLYWWFRSGNVDVFARNFFEFAILEEFATHFLRAAGNTIILALSGEAIGIAIGLVLSMFALSSRAVVRAPARLYINFFRGTPLLWQLSFFFFGIALGLRINLSAYQVAILVLGLNAGAYSAEIFRAGIQSIERGQFEAARSLGMGYFKAMRLVILPQAVRRVIPPFTNEFVILIKDTSLVAFLGLTFQQQELMSAGREIFQQTFNATGFVATAAGYLVVTLPMIRVVTWLERRMRSGLTGIGA
ncbi:MAG: amino acid ABC transporter permease [Thermoleophilia bacterium]|nr:amino acid ABC transporter permease [Thermoleophilia bacterium]